MKRYVHWWSE